ncbi:MAG: MarR family transcriptional regulator [Bifidobacteriaceae bacterium]|jgi:DNA-binding MarR family transcriptional regulator|nr:MarR family transcriptional regulator [Bifidobacteriaceae bacterium]
MKKLKDTQPEQPADILRPGIEIRTLRNMINRYLAATRPEGADTATGGNIPILMYLSKHSDKEIFQYDIENRFGIARSTASRVLGLMEKKGLIERQTVDRDARLRRIVLTDKAGPITEVLKRSAHEMEGVMMKGMSDADKSQLLAYFTLMENNLIATGVLGDSYGKCEEGKREK